MIHLLDLEHICSFQSLEYLYHSHIIKRITPIFIILGSDEASRMMIFFVVKLYRSPESSKFSILCLQPTEMI